MRMMIVQKKGDNSPVLPPSRAELDNHFWNATRRGTVSFAGAPTLPSVTAAEKFWNGEPGAWKSILWSMVERSAIVAPALYIAGEREHVVKYTLAVTAAIEAVVLWQVKRQMGEK